MKRLENNTNQIHFFNFSIIFAFIILIYSCKKDNTSLDLNQEFLGTQNTFHEYETTIWEFEANSNIPFVNVPDTLYNKLSIDSIQISEGVVEKKSFMETLIPLDTTTNHNVSNLEIINAALVIHYSARYYDLEDEIEKISNEEEYSINESNGTRGAVWIENDTIMGYYRNDTSFRVFLKKPLTVGNEWVRNSNKYTNDNGEDKLNQKICKVINKEQVEVKAGTFLAYKIAITNQAIDAKSTDNITYEYYAPSVGLILMEYDMNLYRTIILYSGETTTVQLRKKYRKELVSYSFLQNKK